MKKTAVLMMFICLTLQALTVLAATPDFSGEWVLNTSRSKIPATVKVTAQTMKVTQTADGLTVTSAADKTGNASETTVYDLNGGETTSAIGSVTTEGGEKRVAKITSNGKLSLTTLPVYKKKTGAQNIRYNETWELLDGGSTLKVIRYTETAKGGSNAEMYYTKK